MENWGRENRDIIDHGDKDRKSNNFPSRGREALRDLHVENLSIQRRTGTVMKKSIHDLDLDLA